MLIADFMNVQTRRSGSPLEALGVPGDVAVDTTDEDFGGQSRRALRSAEEMGRIVRASALLRPPTGRVREAWADYVPYSSPTRCTTSRQSPVPRSGWASSLILTIPFYDGGLRYGQQHERKAVGREAHINVEATRQARSDEDGVRGGAGRGRRAQARSRPRKALEAGDPRVPRMISTNLEAFSCSSQRRHPGSGLLKTRRVRPGSTAASVSCDAMSTSRHEDRACPDPS